MDDQHGILMDALNEVRTALSHGAAEDAVLELLQDFIGLTRQHFVSEEGLMERFGFPGLAQQRTQHQVLLAKITQTASSYNLRQVGGANSIAKFLRVWFTEHIEGPDQLYGPWLNERGVR